MRDESDQQERICVIYGDNRWRRNDTARASSACYLDVSSIILRLTILCRGAPKIERQFVGSSVVTPPHDSPITLFCHSLPMYRVVKDHGWPREKREYTVRYPPGSISLEVANQGGPSSVRLAGPIPCCIHVSILHSAASTSICLVQANMRMSRNSPKGIGAAQVSIRSYERYHLHSPHAHFSLGCHALLEKFAAHIIVFESEHSLKWKRHSTSLMFHLACDKRLLQGQRQSRLSTTLKVPTIWAYLGYPVFMHPRINSFFEDHRSTSI